MSKPSKRPSLVTLRRQCEAAWAVSQSDPGNLAKEADAHTARLSYRLESAYAATRATELYLSGLKAPCTLTLRFVRGLAKRAETAAIANELVCESIDEVLRITESVLKESPDLSEMHAVCREAGRRARSALGFALDIASRIRNGDTVDIESTAQSFGF